MDSTDGLCRGMDVVERGGPISMPATEEIRGRLFNVIGNPIDGLGDVSRAKTYPIHRDPPPFDQLTTTKEVLYTGIKVIDLIEPYSKGGKIGLFGGAGVGKTVIIMELISVYPADSQKLFHLSSAGSVRLPLQEDHMACRMCHKN